MLTSSCHFYLFLIWVSHSIFFLKGEMNSSTADASSHWQQHPELQDLNSTCICCHAQTFQVAMESKQTFTSAHLCHCSFICCLHVHSALTDGAYGLKMTHGSPVTTSKPWKTQASVRKFIQWEVANSPWKHDETWCWEFLDAASCWREHLWKEEVLEMTPVIFLSSSGTRLLQEEIHFHVILFSASVRNSRFLYGAFMHIPLYLALTHPSTYTLACGCFPLLPKEFPFCNMRTCLLGFLCSH